MKSSTSIVTAVAVIAGTLSGGTLIYNTAGDSKVWVVAANESHKQSTANEVVLEGLLEIHRKQADEEKAKSAERAKTIERCLSGRTSRNWCERRGLEVPDNEEEEE